jgi:hypothetical protein
VEQSRGLIGTGYEAYPTGRAIIKELSIYLIGWRGYFGFCPTPSVLR